MTTSLPSQTGTVQFKVGINSIRVHDTSKHPQTPPSGSRSAGFAADDDMIGGFRHAQQFYNDDLRGGDHETGATGRKNTNNLRYEGSAFSAFFRSSRSPGYGGRSISGKVKVLGRSGRTRAARPLLSDSRGRHRLLLSTLLAPMTVPTSATSAIGDAESRKLSSSSERALP